MRRYTAAIFVAVLLSGVLFSKEFSGCSFKQPGQAGNIAVTGGFFLSTGLNNLITGLAGELPEFHPAERLYPSASGPGTARSTSSRLAEIIKRSARSDYLFLSEFQIVRFEGPEIIHPYFYSW